MDEPLDHVQRSRGDSSERRIWVGRDVQWQLFDFCHSGYGETRYAFEEFDLVIVKRFICATLGRGCL